MQLNPNNPNHQAELRRQLSQVSAAEAERRLREITRTRQGVEVVNQALEATAYATGNRVFYSSPSDLQTVAHELTHTHQQKG
ncbi:MAG: DUF4157 domain-containing protein [Acidobacteria bacterium]|nr:DUF4157 domain-containing protein [Acidobacteriota bacterium]